MKYHPTMRIAPLLLTCLLAAPAYAADVEVTVTPATQPAPTVDAAGDPVVVPAAAPTVTVKSSSILTDEVKAAVATGLVLIVGAVVASILALVKAGTARIESKLAAVKAEESTKAQDHRIDRLGDNVNQMLRETPPKQ